MNTQANYGSISDSYSLSTLSSDEILVGGGKPILKDFSLEDVKFDYEPYPIGFVKNIFPSNIFDELVATFPSEELMTHLAVAGNKYLLSEGSNPSVYLGFVKSHSAWHWLYDFIKSPQFVQYLYSFLRSHHVDLGISQLPIRFPQADEKLTHRYVTARFEFGSLPTNGGYHLPHTDIEKKIVSLVVSMTPNDIWQNPHVGGMSVCWPKKRELIYNQINKGLSLEEVSIIRSYDFLANAGVIFPKTFNSWHCVEPVFNQNVTHRRTIVIQLIESK